jgi:hypothetical protein
MNCAAGATTAAAFRAGPCSYGLTRIAEMSLLMVAL